MSTSIVRWSWKGRRYHIAYDCLAGWYCGINYHHPDEEERMFKNDPLHIPTWLRARAP